MTKLLEKLLNNVSNLVESDITCLIKFDQNKFSLVKYSSRNKNIDDLNSILEKTIKSDFNKFNNEILSLNKYSDSIYESFNIGNFVYYLYSISSNSKHFDKKKKQVHSQILDSFKELISELVKNKNNSLGNTDSFQLITDASEELIFILDKSGAFTYINSLGTTQLKYSKEEIIGKHFFQIIKDQYKGTVGTVFQKLLKEKSKNTFEAELIPKVGIEQLYKIKLIPIIENDCLEKLFGLGINLSLQNIEKKRSEKLLAKLTEANRLNAIERDRAKQQISVLSELNNLKNDFISNVSHELRTPLASIIGFSETIIEDKNLTVERAKEFNEVILTESKRLAQLINDVLDFSELENEQQSLQKTSINVIEVINNSVKKYKNKFAEKNITLTSSIPEAEITIFADYDRISKAINYLLSNAVKFTKKNGCITILAQEFLKEVEIVISDTGVGIPEEKLPILFDKFNKVKQPGNNLPGAGFGLVTVKQIIDLHKGLIKVKSEVNKGTSFIIRLPKYSFN